MRAQSGQLPGGVWEKHPKLGIFELCLKGEEEFSLSSGPEKSTSQDNLGVKSLN